MGMYLSIYALSDATIERLHVDPPLTFRAVARCHGRSLAPSRARPSRASAT